MVKKKGVKRSAKKTKKAKARKKRAKSAIVEMFGR